VRIAEEDETFYRDRILPQQEQNVELAQKSFDLGFSDLDSLLNILQAHAAALQSYEDAINARRAGVIGLQQAAGLVIGQMTPDVIQDALTRAGPAIADQPPEPPGASPDAPSGQPSQNSSIGIQP
jgi:hypothetical protein